MESYFNPDANPRKGYLSSIGVGMNYMPVISSPLSMSHYLGVGGDYETFRQKMSGKAPSKGYC